MARSLDVFDESNFDLKLVGEWATSKFEFFTPLKSDKRSILVPIAGKDGLPLLGQAELALGNDQSGDTFISPINFTDFGLMSDAAVSASPAIAKAPEDSASRTPKLASLDSEVSQANVSPKYNVSKVAQSGDIKIDALIDSHKWRDTTITYSFFDGGYYDGDPDEKNVKEITGQMKSYLRHILEKVIEPLINLDFVEVSDKGDNFGQIRYMFSDGPSYAYAYMPDEGNWWEGDVHLNPKDINSWNKGPGSYGYETLIHETLHTLGLDHPGNYNGSQNGGQSGPFLPDNVDTNANTVMTYNDDSVNAITLMTYDIKALQYLYGAKQHKAGDTTYKFDSVYGYTTSGNFFGSKTQEIKQTIWDSAGNDTFDFSGLAFKQSGYRLDLREDGWITTQDAYQASSYKAEGDGKTYKTTAFGTKTAYNMTIENVVTSSSSDRIILNQAANTISGYQVGKKIGNDIIVKANGLDKLDLSGYKSADVTQTIQGKDLVLGLDGDGSITLKDYFAASQPDRIKILFDGTTPPPPPSGPNTVLGTEGNDLLEGTDGVDLIKAHSGDDTLKGLTGDDRLRGGKGNDLLKGGKGNDTLEGGKGTDTLEGGKGTDTLDGGLGNDILLGGSGNDILTGGDGQDTFVYETVDHRRDTITDFEIGIDKIDLRAIFKGSNYTSANTFKDYVRLEQLGADTKVRVNILGDNGEQFKTMAQLTNVDKSTLSADHFKLS